MNNFRLFLTIFLALILAITFVSCKKTDNTGDSTDSDSDTTTVPGSTSATTDKQTTSGDDTTDDNTEPVQQKTAYEIFEEAIAPLNNSNSVDANLSHKFSYSIAGIAYNVDQTGNIKNTLVNDKPVSLSSLTIKTNDTTVSGTVYADSQYSYANMNGQKIKHALPANLWQIEFVLDEGSFFDLAHEVNDGSTTITGKCLATVLAPLTNMLNTTASAPQISQISDVAFTAFTAFNGVDNVIERFEYSFNATVGIPNLPVPSTNVTHTGSINFNSFGPVTITPPSDLNSYVVK